MSLTVMFTNNAVSTLSGSITADDTTIPLQSGAGALWPDLAAGPSGAWCPTTLVDSSNNIEIVWVTAINGDVLTVTRGQEGTTAQAFASGSYVGLRLTAAAIDEITTAVGDLQTLSASLAPLASPTFTGTPEAPDANAETTSQIATTGYIADSVFSTGDIKLTLKTTSDPGWIMADDGTIGNASSGATYANATCEALYTLLWNNISNSYAPVTGGRGSSASADWAAQKPIALTKILGRALAAAGSGSGLTAYSLGETVGTNTNIFAQENLPSGLDFDVAIPSGQGTHTHSILSVTDAGGPTIESTSSSTTDILAGATYEESGSYEWLQIAPNNGDDFIQSVSLPAMTGTAASGGSGDAINNMQPTSFLNVMIKL